MLFRSERSKRLVSTAAIGVSVVLAAGLAGCAAAEPDETGEVELLLWLQRDEYLPTDTFAQFEQDNPGVTVRTVTVPAEEQISTFLRSAAAGDTPDVLMPTTDLWPALAEQGVLYDMTDQLAQWEAEDPEGYADAAAGIAFGTAEDGITYGVGISGAPTWMTYRADWFDEAGLDIPETYDDLLDAARVIKQERPEVTPFGIVGARSSSPAAKFLTLFYRMGGESVDGIPQFDSEAGQYLLEYYQTLVREDLAHPDTLAWTSGESRGSLIEGIEAVTMISQNIYPTVNEKLEFGAQWDVLPELYREGAESDMVMTFRAVTALVSGDTEHPDAAALLVRYLAGPDYGLDLSMRYQPSLNASVATNPEYLEVAPWAPELEPYVAAAKPLPANAFSSDLYEIIHDMKQEAIANPNADAADIAKRAQAQMAAVAEG